MKYVITPDVALALAADRLVPADDVQLLAPTLLRSQVLTDLYAQVRGGSLQVDEARARLAHVQGLRPRLLGDRVLQKVAWEIAEELGWTDTFTAEYLALTRLQADALVTLDDRLRAVAGDLVPTADYEHLRRC